MKVGPWAHRKRRRGVEVLIPRGVDKLTCVRASHGLDSGLMLWLLRPEPEDQVTPRKSTYRRLGGLDRGTKVGYRISLVNLRGEVPADTAPLIH